MSIGSMLGQLRADIVVPHAALLVRVPLKGLEKVSIGIIIA